VNGWKRPAAYLKVAFVNAPVVEVVMKRHDASFVQQVKLAGTIEVNNGSERCRVSIEKDFVVLDIQVIAKLENNNRPLIASPEIRQQANSN